MQSMIKREKNSHVILAITHEYPDPDTYSK